MNNNTDKFTDKASNYQSFRPSYPTELINYLYTRVGLSEKNTIADIGSGTGLFSAPLLQHGSTVYAVEPNTDMREAANTHLAQYPRFHSIAASAEHTGLPSQSIDFITVAQAFHWFDQLAFKAECQRLLKPNGKVILIWNGRDFSHPVIQAEYELRQKYSSKQSKEDPSRFAKDWTAFFTDGICEYKTCRNDQLLSKEAFIGLTLSRSWAPTEQETAKYQEFITELTAIFERYQENQHIIFPQLTQCYVGTVS